MKYVIMIAALALAAPVAAQAQEHRLTDGSFVSASRCAAYADLPQLAGDNFNATSLKAAVDDYSGPTFMRRRGEDAARAVRVNAQRSAAEDLREQRAAACASFAASGLVAGSGGAQAS